MSSSSPHGFVVVRRGYRPGQVDGHVTDLTEERDTAQRHADRLAEEADEAAAEAERLTALAAGLPPQTYEVLGARAQSLLTVAEAEAADLRAGAEADAGQTAERARAEAAARTDAARTRAQRVRDEAEVTATRTEQAAQSRAADLRAEAEAEAESLRTAASAALEEMRQRCADLLSGQEKQQAHESEALGHELAECEGEVDARVAGLEAHAQQVLTEARRGFADAEEAARYQLEDAEAQATAILTEARAREERVQRETERVLSGHAERGQELRQHMTHVRNSLAALTGRGPDTAVPALPEQAGRDDA